MGEFHIGMVADILLNLIPRSDDLNSLEANMRRHGYSMKEICDTVEARPAEIRAFFKNSLAETRTKEIQQEIFKLGITRT